MENVKSFFSNQLRRAGEIREGSDLYYLFFRLSQVWALIASFYFLATFVPLTYIPLLSETEKFNSAIYTSIIFRTFILVVLCEIGLRCLDKNRTVGLYLGVVLSFKSILGMTFFLGFFGLYAFLNTSAQNRFLSDAPPWVKDVLTLLKINFISEE